MTTLILPRPSQHAPDLTPDEARALTDRIRATVADLLPLIKEAFDRRADVALGYATWLDYCDTELRGLRLPVAQRREAVTELRQAGMTQPAIAASLGVSQSTIRDDLAEVSKTTNLPAAVTGLDGKQYPATRPEATRDTGDVGVGVKREAGTDAAPRPETDPEAAVAAAIEAHLPPDPSDEFRAWRRGFMSDVGATYRAISRNSAEEVARLADDECVTELERAAVELTRFAAQVRRLRAQSLPENVVPIGRP